MDNDFYFPTEATTIGQMCEEARLRGINLKLLLNGIPVFATPSSDSFFLKSRHEWECKVESFIVNEEFHFAPGRKVYELTCNCYPCEAFSLRVGRVLQYNMKVNPNKSFKKVSIAFFSSLIEEIPLPEKEFDEIVGCLCVNWYYRKKLAGIRHNLYKESQEELRKRNS